jgi:hypothetical protein
VTVPRSAGPAGLLPKANICRRPRMALSGIAEPGVTAQAGCDMPAGPPGRSWPFHGQYRRRDRVQDPGRPGAQGFRAEGTEPVARARQGRRWHRDVAHGASPCSQASRRPPAASTGSRQGRVPQARHAPGRSRQAGLEGHTTAAQLATHRSRCPRTLPESSRQDAGRTAGSRARNAPAAIGNPVGRPAVAWSTG